MNQSVRLMMVQMAIYCTSAREPELAVRIKCAKVFNEYLHNNRVGRAWGRWHLLKNGLGLHQPDIYVNGDLLNNVYYLLVK